MTDPNRVPFNSKWELLQPTSPERLCACSGFTFCNGSSRDSPTASVSSVNGVGAKTPVPVETRTVHFVAGRKRADMRGLKKHPYTLCTSTRALPEIVTREVSV